MHVFDSKITMGGEGGTTNDAKKRRQDKGRHKRKNGKETKKNKPQNIITLQPDIHRQNL